MFEIKKGINIPPKKGPNIKYPLLEMEVGDMFELPKERRLSLNSLVHIIKKKYKKTFSIRCISDTTYGCWRIK